MLVLSRRVGEKIEIGNGITVTVLRVTGKTVRIGIEAPECVSIRRSEIILDHHWPTPPAISESNSEVLHSQESPRSV